MSPRAAICDVFDSYCREAVAVAWCESRLTTTAANGQYRGLFQMGSYERGLFGHGDTGHEQALASVQDPAVQATEDSADRLRAIISRYTAWHARHHVAARVCQFELAALTSEHYEEILDLRDDQGSRPAP